MESTTATVTRMIGVLFKSSPARVSHVPGPSASESQPGGVQCCQAATVLTWRAPSESESTCCRGPSESVSHLKPTVTGPSAPVPPCRSHRRTRSCSADVISMSTGPPQRQPTAAAWPLSHGVRVTRSRAP